MDAIIRYKMPSSAPYGQPTPEITNLLERTPGNRDATFLKYTVLYNFGKPSQRIEDGIVRLSKKGNEQLLLKIQTR